MVSVHKSIRIAIADLILRCQGNARELDELVGILDAHLACSEFDRDSLLPGVPGQKPSPALPTMTDLFAGEQRLIFESALFGAIALESLRMVTFATAEYLMDKLSEGVNIVAADMTKEQITESLHNYLKLPNENLCKQVFRSITRPDNN